MKKELKRSFTNGAHHFADGKKVFGLHDDLRGDVTGLSGDVDDCNITPLERSNGISVLNLINGE